MTMNILNTYKLRLFTGLFAVQNSRTRIKPQIYLKNGFVPSVAPCHWDFSDGGQLFYGCPLKEIDNYEGESLKALLYEMSTEPNPGA